MTNVKATNLGKKFPKAWRDNISKSLKGRTHLVGEKNPNWGTGKYGPGIKTGRCGKDKQPYLLERISTNKYVAQHRLVIEKKLGRKLKSSEVVHHLDGNRTNNSVSNLKLFKSHKEHAEFEQSLALFLKQIIWSDKSFKLKQPLKKLFNKYISK